MQAADFMGCQELRKIIMKWLQGVLKEVVQHGRAAESVGVAAATLQLSSIPRMSYYTKVRWSLVLVNLISYCPTQCEQLVL